MSKAHHKNRSKSIQMAAPEIAKFGESGAGITNCRDEENQLWFRLP
jgi:hypothetical protein